MADVPRTVFEPKPLRRSSLETPLGAGMRLLPTEDRIAIQARREAHAERIRPLGSAMRWRLAHYVLRSVLCVPVVLWLFLDVPWSVFWITVPVSALYGVAVAWLRPSEGLAGWLLVGIGMIIPALAGTLRIGLLTVLGLACLYLLGMAVGVAQWLRRMDGE